MITNLSGINSNNSKIIVNRRGNKEFSQAETLLQDSSVSAKTSSAVYSYGLAQINKKQTENINSIQEKSQNNDNSLKTLNIFFFSDMHGELNGLTNLAAAKEAAEKCCGGAKCLTVLGSGDLVTGSQKPVIQATIDVVNQMGMQATSLGNHERMRSNEDLLKLNQSLDAKMLAINASKDDKQSAVIPSMICKQGDTEFIVVGAKPLSQIENPQDIPLAIDEEVNRIKENRRANGLNDNLPVIFLSHMGSYADKIAAENSETIDVILGGHSHHIEEFNYQSKNGKNVHVIQAGKNNALATVLKMEIQPDGTIYSSSHKINLKSEIQDICTQVQNFYGNSDNETVLKAAKTAEKETSKIIENNVGSKVNIAYVPEGQGYTLYTDGYEKDRERCYSNPVANILADAILAETKNLGVQAAVFNGPSVKDTAIDDKTFLTNYDIISRLIPFGGSVVVGDVPVDKLYEAIEKEAQTIFYKGGSQLAQVGGLSYSMDAEKAKARLNAYENIARAEDNLKKAQQSGKDISEAERALADAQEKYNSLPGCVEKILMLKEDGSELKINPKAIARGDYKGVTIKCAMSEYYAHKYNIEAQNTGKTIASVFEKGIKQVQKENDGNFCVDHNDVRISIKDKNGLVNGYEVSTGINTKYWY